MTNTITRAFPDNTYIEIGDFFGGYDYYYNSYPVIYPLVTIVISYIDIDIDLNDDSLMYVFYDPIHNGLSDIYIYYNDIDIIELSRADKKALKNAINQQLKKWYNTSLEKELEKANNKFFNGKYASEFSIVSAEVWIMKKIKYRDRYYINHFRCIDKIKTIILFECWYHGNLLYGYRDRYNTITISKSDIISIQEV